jgi:dienelactone hydrolase
MAASRLLGHGHPVEHVCFEGAGHALSLPSLPPIVSVPGAYQGRDLMLGGSPAINARAAIDATARAVSFLQQHLQAVT